MKRRLGSALGTLERLAESRRGAGWLFLAGVAMYALQSLALPLVGGRDVGTYLRYYAQMWQWDSVLPMTMLYRTPVAPLVTGTPLDVAGGWLAQCVLAVLFAGSIVAWTAVATAFGRRVAVLVGAALLFYPGYGILFHTVSSDAVFAAVFALWAYLITRAVLVRTGAAFALAGLATALTALTRPGNQVLLAFVLLPFVLQLRWRRRLGLAAAFAAVAVAVLGTWAGLNGARYDDVAVARGGAAFVPFYRVFVEDQLVRPENGGASKELAMLVARDLLDEEPYRSYGIDLETFFRDASPRMFEDVVWLSDRVYGWDDDYTQLRKVGLEAVRAHPGAFASGVAATVWDELWKPLYIALSDEAETEAQPVATPAGLPLPSEGEPIPSAHQGFYWTRPDGGVREVWSSPTTHHLVFDEPGEQLRFDELTRRMSELEAELRPYEGSAALTLWLSRSSRLWPRPVLWLLAGAAALVVRRPVRTALAVALAAGGLAVIGLSALGTYAIVEIAVPVVPAFVLFGAVGLLGDRVRPVASAS